MFHSFRTRLIIAFVALFAAISVTVNFVALVLREQQIRNMYDKELLTRAEGIKGSINALEVIDDHSLQQVISELSSTIYFRDFYIQVYNEKDQPVARSKNLGPLIIPLYRPAAERSRDGEIIDGKIPQKPGSALPENLRGLRLRFERPDGTEYIVIITADRAYILDSVSSLRWVLAAGNVAGIFAAAGAAWLVTGAMSKRLKAIRNQLTSVGPQSLETRLSIGDRDEISELASHVNSMLDRLKAGFETQERFIHDASHEFKTPIATVQAEAQALLIGEPTREELIDFTRSMSDEMKRLGRLAEALLLLTRANDQLILSRFHPVDACEVVTGAIKHLSMMAADHQVEIKLENSHCSTDPIMIRCDSELVESMISNLIRNAIRFSPRQSSVNLSIHSDNGHAVITVQDYGPGIPLDVMPHIFDRYFHSSQSRVRRGAGLGLAIASTVAALHGGSIKAANRTGEGAIFTVRLPQSNNL